MLKQLIEFDHRFFEVINSLHNPFFDEIMYWASYKYTWIPLYAIIIYFIFRQYKRQGLIIVIGIVLTLILCDQLSVLIKDYFMRLRPSHNAIYATIIHLNHGIKGGTYGFVSSHAANTSGFATFLIFFPIFRKKIIIVLLIFWVLLISYSRIYNGLHYPADVIGGIFLGFFVGIGITYATKIVILKNKKYKLKN
ncbi:MAG: phosphatase PAP2 family protein [Bacteroidales bacterium]|nr:phosphatase PAP2 family protein [Bacteroidales bacterium]